MLCIKADEVLFSTLRIFARARSLLL